MQNSIYRNYLNCLCYRCYQFIYGRYPSTSDFASQNFDFNCKIDGFNYFKSKQVKLMKDTEAIEYDQVEKPKHYNSLGAKCSKCDTLIECIDVTRHMSFNIGNAVKYLWRFKEKNGLEDLRKAAWYINDAIKQMETTENENE